MIIDGTLLYTILEISEEYGYPARRLTRNCGPLGIKIKEGVDIYLLTKKEVKDLINRLKEYDATHKKS